MSLTVNPATGLREGFDGHFNVPIVHQRSVSRVVFSTRNKAVHVVPTRQEGVTLDFYARLKRSDELVVTFQGALSPEKNIHPLFPRVTSLRHKADNMMSIADPTILADKNREMLLSWYLGGPGWDPLRWIINAVRKAQGRTGAQHVAFLGGSGGGFAALRASAIVPGSMAFIQDPQTAIEKYIPRVVGRYFKTVWPGWDQRTLMAAFPERFDMVRYYTESLPRNFVYYAQNSTDLTHVERHYTPFRIAHGLKNEDGLSPSKSRLFALYEGERHGHGMIAAGEFDYHYDQAMDAWRSWRRQI